MAHGDYTGQNKAVLAQQYAQQQKFAAQNMTLVNQVVTEGRNEVVDLFNDEDYDALDRGQDPGRADGEVVEVDGADPEFQPVKFRARESLENVTIGKDRHMNLEEGRTYQAPLWVVRHLDEKQLVWH